MNKLKINLLFFVFSMAFTGCANKAKLIVNKWLVTETEIAGQKLSGELVDGFYMEINENGSYKLVGMGEEKGKWMVKDDSLITTNEANRTAAYVIKEISETKLVLFDNSVGASATTSFKKAD